MLLLWHILVFIIMLLKNGENWPRPFFSIYGMAKFKHQSTLECYICPKYCLKIAQKLNNTDFIYLVLSNFVTISRINYWDQVNSWKKKNGNSGMVHFAEINQPLFPWSILQHIARVATPKLLPRTCFRYLQRTLIIGGLGLVSEFM